MILTDLQCDMLLAAAAKPDEVIHCDETLGERWSAQLGGKYFNGSREVVEAFDGLVRLGYLEFNVEDYAITPAGRHAAANLRQGKT